jgi:hypothetical protein
MEIFVKENWMSSRHYSAAGLPTCKLTGHAARNGGRCDAAAEVEPSVLP